MQVIDEKSAIGCIGDKVINLTPERLITFQASNISALHDLTR